MAEFTPDPQELQNLVIDPGRDIDFAFLLSPEHANGAEPLVSFTDAGRQFLRDAEQIKHEIEAEYTAILGAERMAALRAALVTLLGDTDAPD